MCLSLYDVRHLAQYPLGPSVLSHMVQLHSFLWLIFHCKKIFNIFFIRSSIVGHLSCFPILAIITKAAANIGMYIGF